jgi:hypothetical protein
VPNESARTILDELRRDLDDLMIAHGFACIGLRRIREHLANTPKHGVNEDPIIHLEGLIPDDPDWPKNPGWLPSAEWRLSEALEQVEDNGPVEMLLGRQWIISVYALWEERYRPRLAKAHGRQTADEKYALLGDLRLLRNDVVHNGGIATVSSTGHCEILNWFRPGEIIMVDGRHFGEFLRLFPWLQLESGDLS